MANSINENNMLTPPTLWDKYGPHLSKRAAEGVVCLIAGVLIGLLVDGLKDEALRWAINRSPEVKGMWQSDNSFRVGETGLIVITATDPNSGDRLDYDWRDSILGENVLEPIPGYDHLRLLRARTPMSVKITVKVSDRSKESVSQQYNLEILPKTNMRPSRADIVTEDGREDFFAGEKIQLKAEVEDRDTVPAKIQCEWSTKVKQQDGFSNKSDCNPTFNTEILKKLPAKVYLRLAVKDDNPDADVVWAEGVVITVKRKPRSQSKPVKTPTPLPRLPITP